MKRASALPVVAILALSSSAASAAGPSPQGEKAACLDASASAQTLRTAHKLVEAREKLRICTRQVCPGIVQKDCATWLDAVEQSLPTVVILAKDDAGRDVVDVRVTVDGQPFSSKLQGDAVPLDPGSHAAHFEAAGGATADQTLLVREGGKNQTVSVVLHGSPSPAPAWPPAAAPATPLPGPPPGPATPETSSGLGTQKILGITAAAAGVVGVGLGAVFGLLASAALNNQKNDCATPTNCSDHAAAESQHSTLDTDSTVSTVAFAAGGALLAGGAILFFTGGKAAESGGTGTAWLVAPSVGAASAGIALHGGF